MHKRRKGFGLDYLVGLSDPPQILFKRKGTLSDLVYLVGPVYIQDQLRREYEVEYQPKYQARYQPEGRAGRAA